MLREEIEQVKEIARAIAKEEIALAIKAGKVEDTKFEQENTGGSNPTDK